MTRSGWLLFVVTASAQLAILVAAGWAMWAAFPPDQREAAEALLAAAGGLPIVAVIALVATTGLCLHLVFGRWVAPLRSLAEGTRLIAVSNPKHRLGETGAGDVREMVGSVNLLADRFQALHEDVEIRIREANALLEEEKNTLATLMSKLTQGVLVCNPEGRILLYNPRAQRLLEGPARESGGGDWIGLGRSVYGLVDVTLIEHALDNIRHRLANRDANLLVPFVASRPGGQLLSMHLVPILDHERDLRGYILTFEDITRRFGTESRRGVLLQSLTQGQRSAIAGIRAAIETVLSFPDMDESGRQQFFEVISDEALKMSSALDQLEGEYAQDMKAHLPLEDVLGSDLIAAVERQLRESRQLGIEVSAPVEPVWLRVDSYVVSQCMLFLVDQLTQWCRATDLTLTLACKRSLASLELQWSGAILHMEALRSWGLRNVSTDPRGSTMSLFEAIEQYGGAVWPDKPGADGRPCLRLILPVSENDESWGPVRSDDAYGHDFDFHLFEQRTGSRDLQALPLDRLAITVVDTETTGLDPDQDEIIAVGAVRIVNGRILRRESFDTFVRPKRTISEASRAIHGITSDMLRAEPRIDEVLPRLHRFVEDTVIVGHNVAFDMRFFDAVGRRIGVSFANPVLDTLLLECAINLNQSDKSLEAIAGRLGIQVTGRHTALGDALTTAEVLLALIPLLQQQGIRTLGDALRECQNSPFAKMTA